MWDNLIRGDWKLAQCIWPSGRCPGHAPAPGFRRPETSAEGLELLLVLRRCRPIYFATLPSLKRTEDQGRRYHHLYPDVKLEARRAVFG